MNHVATVSSLCASIRQTLGWPNPVTSWVCIAWVFKSWSVNSAFFVIFFLSEPLSKWWVFLFCGYCKQDQNMHCCAEECVYDSHHKCLLLEVCLRFWHWSIHLKYRIQILVRSLNSKHWLCQSVKWVIKGYRRELADFYFLTNVSANPLPQIKQGLPFAPYKSFQDAAKNKWISPGATSMISYLCSAEHFLLIRC